MADIQGALSTLEDAPRDDDLDSNVTTGLLQTLAAPHQTTAEAQERARGILDTFTSPESTSRQEEALQEMRETAETSRQALKDAKARLLGQPVFDDRSKWLNFAAAMSRPTKTGAFAESLGFGAESLAGSLDQKRAAERQRSDDLLQLETGESAIDERLAAMLYKDQLAQREIQGDLAKEALKTLGRSIGKPGGTKGVDALDRSYVKKFVDWTSTGRVSSQKSLSELRAAIDMLDQSDSISGPIIGLVPKILRDVVSPDSGNVQDLIETTAQKSMRDTIGAQFAQREGEMLLARTFNPRLEEHVNKARAKRLIQQISNVAEENDRQAAYFRANGTLAGYQPDPTTSFEAMMEELDSITEESLTEGADVQPGVVERLTQNLVGGAEDPEAETEMITVRISPEETVEIPKGGTKVDARKAYEEKYGRKPTFAEGGEVELEALDETSMEALPDEEGTEIDLSQEVMGAGAGAATLTGLDELRQMMGTSRRPGDVVGQSLRDPEAALSALADRQVKDIPGGLADVGGPGVEMLEEKALGHAGESTASTYLEEMGERGEEAGERITERVKTGLKASPYFEQEAKLADDLYSNARPLYQTAYDAHPGIPESKIPALKKIMKTPDGKKAVKIALRLLQNQDKEIGRKDAIGLVHRPSLEFLDLVKRGFDQIISKEENRGPTALGRSMRELRGEFRGQLDEVAPEYTAARNQYAGDLEVLDSIRSGRKDFKNLQPEELVKKFEDLSVSEKVAFRSGVAQHLLEQIDKAGMDRNPAQKVLSTPANAKRLRAVFPDPAEFEIFQEAMRAESAMFTREKRVRNRGERALAKRIGEQTTGIGKVSEQVAIIPVIGRFPVIRWALRILQRRPNMSEAEADEILEILRSRDVKEIQRQMDEVPKTQRSKRRGKVATVGAGVGTALGMLMEEEE